jgi:hypothetical protein
MGERMMRRNEDEPTHERERGIGRTFPTESMGVRLADLPTHEAKELRKKFGDAKYGHDRPCSMLAEAYIEGVDMLNYADRALEYDELDPAEHVTLANMVGVVLDFLRKRMPRTE